MGYSLTLKKVYVYVWFHNGAQHMPMNNVYHYLSQKFFFYVGRDGVDHHFQGRLAHVKLHYGPGSFSHRESEIEESDVFGYKFGDSLVVEDDSIDVDDPVNDEWDHKAPQIINVGHDTKPAKVKVIAGIDEGYYGYGYWLRFIPYYPK
jgi:hypothetical protein